jgi:hypothetical protein
MNSRLLAAAVLSTTLLIHTGCIPILIHAGVEAESQENAAYSEYLNDTARLNFEREKAGMPTQEPLTREEWRKTLKSKSVKKAGYQPPTRTTK